MAGILNFSKVIVCGCLSIKCILPCLKLFLLVISNADPRIPYKHITPYIQTMPYLISIQNQRRKEGKDNQWKQTVHSTLYFTF